MSIAKKIKKNPHVSLNYPTDVIFKRILGYGKPYKKTLVKLFLLLMASSITNLAFPVGTTFILAILQPESGNTLDTFLQIFSISLDITILTDAERLNLVYRIGFLLIGIMIINFITKKIYQYEVAKLSQYILFDIRSEMFEHVQKLGLDFHSSMPSGKLISRLTNDVDVVQALVSNQIIQLIADIFMTITMFVILLIWSWQLTFLIIFIMPIFIALFVLIAKKSRYYHREQRQKIAEITRMLQETVSGIRTVKAFVKEDSNINSFNIVNKQDKNISFQAAKLQAYMEPVTQLVMAAAIGTIIFAGSALMQQGHLRLDVLLGYVIMAGQFITPVNNIGNFYNVAQASIVAGDRIFETLDKKSTVADKEDAKELPPIQGNVEYSHVNFRYVKDVPVLDDININIKPKQRYAFVGFTGAGKTTLISLLSRFYDASEGEIKIDGMNIKDVTLRSLRSQIGVVLQDTFLFGGTVMENIRYGKLNATDEEVYAAAKRVGAHEFILQLPEGYETDVRERGSLLSVGQRQLISFARALLSNPPILILDEATSSVDPYTELKIQEALEELLKQRTSFIIAHRLSTILNSDVICVMEKGKIIQRGSHNELIEMGGVYKHLYEMQFKKNQKTN